MVFWSFSIRALRSCTPRYPISYGFWQTVASIFPAGDVLPASSSRSKVTTVVFFRRSGNFETSSAMKWALYDQRPEYIVSTSEFDTVKHRLEGIEANQKVKNTNPNKPTLRKRTDQNKGGSTSSGGTDNGNSPAPALVRTLNFEFF